LFDVENAYRKFSGIFWHFRLIAEQRTGDFDTGVVSLMDFVAIIFGRSVSFDFAIPIFPHTVSRLAKS
jgi:hypothetical protein